MQTASNLKLWLPILSTEDREMVFDLIEKVLGDTDA